jgi:hypothetical protein
MLGFSPSTVGGKNGADPPSVPIVGKDAENTIWGQSKGEATMAGKPAGG